LRHILEPALHELSQTVLAPGARTHVRERLGRLIGGDATPDSILALDVGCGYFSPLAAFGCEVTGLDIDAGRIRHFGPRGIVGSATSLSFADGHFDIVLSIGLLHHLDDADARRAIGEMRRVARLGGQIVIFDAVLPETAWRRPLAAAIRTLDFGAHMRGQAALRMLFDASDWRCERVTYAATGLEGVWFLSRGGEE